MHAWLRQSLGALGTHKSAPPSAPSLVPCQAHLGEPRAPLAWCLRPSFGGFLVDAPAFGGRALVDLRLRPRDVAGSLCSALRAFGGEVTWISASGKHLSGLLRISLVFSSGWGRSARLVRADRPHPDDTGVPGRLCRLYGGEVDPEPWVDAGGTSRPATFQPSFHPTTPEAMWEATLFSTARWLLRISRGFPESRPLWSLIRDQGGNVT